MTGDSPGFSRLKKELRKKFFISKSPVDISHVCPRIESFKSYTYSSATDQNPAGILVILLIGRPRAIDQPLAGAILNGIEATGMHTV